MTDDIIEQLRKMEASAVAKWPTTDDVPLTIAGLAANEIEYLRNRIKVLESQIEGLTVNEASS